jgi:Fe-S cluster biogenesis protein NfuA
LGICRPLHGRQNNRVCYHHGEKYDEKEIPMVEEDDVKAVLDLIRPNLQMDGGDIQFVDVNEDGVVSVELQGACNGCPLSQMTLANGVERILKERVPGVTRVVPAMR